MIQELDRRLQPNPEFPILPPVEAASGRADVVPADPKWVLVGGCVLAFLAAAVNADFMLRLGVSVSHLTGDLSRFTVEAQVGRGYGTNEAAILALSLAGFVGGAATAGYFIHQPKFTISRPYGRSIMFVGFVLMICHPLLKVSVLWPCFLAAWACGLQNALATRFRGLVLRTTHITGLLTDLGQLIGMKLRGHPIESWKIKVPLLLATAFACGAAAGAALHLRTPVPVTLACGAVYFVGGLVWSVFKRRHF